MAVRISGVNLADKKHVVVALTEIYGIGRPLSKKILKVLDIKADMMTRDLTEGEEKKLRDYIELEIKVEGDLRRDVAQNIKHMKDVGTYRGTRHAKRLPARGQRTKTNSRTVRGNVRRTAGSGRRPAGEKT